MSDYQLEINLVSKQLVAKSGILIQCVPSLEKLHFLALFTVQRPLAILMTHKIVQAIEGQFHLTACLQREEHQPIIIATLPLFPESGVSIPVKFIFRDFFRCAGIVEILYTFCEVQYLVLIFPKRHNLFLSGWENKPNSISLMDGGPVCSRVAAADLNFGQVIICNKRMPNSTSNRFKGKIC